MAAKSFVVVDRSRSCGVEIRETVVGAGDTAHVFAKFAPALAMVERKHIDAVLVEFDTDKETTAFCAAVQKLGVALIYLSTPLRQLDVGGYGFIASFPNLPNSPRLPVQYIHH